MYIHVHSRQISYNIYSQYIELNVLRHVHLNSVQKSTAVRSTNICCLRNDTLNPLGWLPLQYGQDQHRINPCAITKLESGIGRL